MASENKMDQFNSFLADECCCPICLDEFIEPKSLSSCLHNICESCLEKMCRSDPYSPSIQCPVCRQQSKLPRGGVSAMPTNKLLVRLIEKAPGRLEKMAIKNALEETKKKVSEMKQNLEKIDNFHSERNELREHLKEEITSTADKLIAKIQQEKKRLLDEVDFHFDATDANALLWEKEEITNMLERATNCTEFCEDLLRRGNPTELMEMKDTVLLQLREFDVLPLGFDIDFDYDSLDASFDGNIKLGELLEEKGIGDLRTVKLKVPSSFPLVDCGGACGSEGVKMGNLVKTLKASDLGISEFFPFAVAVSQSTGDIAILNEIKKKVFVLDETGQKVCSAQIQYGDLYDIAFSKDGDLIVVNHENSRLLHYGGKNGIFKRKRLDPVARDIKFKYVSVDVDGKFIVSCDSEDGNEVTVQVYDQNRNFLFSFGEDELVVCGKAVYHNGNFFVLDGDCVKVFDGNGVFKQQFGDFFSPAGLDLDYYSGNVLIVDQEDNTLHVYRAKDGKFLTKWETRPGPSSVALTKSGNIYVTCFSGKCVQCFSYK